jgi:hypothetical protein
MISTNSANKRQVRDDREKPSHSRTAITKIWTKNFLK